MGAMENVLSTLFRSSIRSLPETKFLERGRRCTVNASTLASQEFPALPWDYTAQVLTFSHAHLLTSRKKFPNRLGSKKEKKKS